MKIYLATWLYEISQGKSLTKTIANRRLLSYFHAKEKCKELPHYIKKGTNENLSCSHSARK